jgi:CoA:oxalate CoA-transferase
MSGPSAEPGVESPSPRRAQARLPLHGMRVIACELLVALPFGTQLLADFGADVIDVEHYPARSDADSRWRLRTGRHKRRISVNLRTTEGRQIVQQLVAQADVFAENYRPGVIDKYDLGYERLREINPGIVYASMSGFGHQDILPSPLTDLASYGPIGEAMGGVADMLGPRPGVGSLALGDITSTLFATVGIMVALWDRQRTGQGQYVDIAMADSLLALCERPVLMHLLSKADGLLDSAGSGTVAEPMPSGFGSWNLNTTDGRCTLTMMDSADSAQWTRFCYAMDHPEWLDDARIWQRETRERAIRDIVRPVVDEWASSRSKFEVARVFREVGLAAAPVLRPHETLREPHFQARRMFTDVIDEDGRRLSVVGNPIKLSRVERALSESPGQPPRIARPGDHTREVLRMDLNMSDQEIDDLAEREVVGISRSPDGRM